jgi:uncharacterized protein YbjT (DUF2867 family)
VAENSVGGGAVSHLLRDGHHVRVIPHDAENAVHLQGTDAEVIRADSRDRKERNKALSGIDGALLLSHSGGGRTEEVRHGRTMIDACAQKEIGHVVFSSVCRANKKTGVPQFEANHENEKHRKETGGRGIGRTVPWPRSGSESAAWCTMEADRRALGRSKTPSAGDGKGNR